MESSARARISDLRGGVARGEARQLTAERPAAQQLEVFVSTRDRTLALIAGLDDVDLARVVDPLLSPILWDLGHIANFEQRWLLKSQDARLDDVYNPFAHARGERGDVDFLDSDSCFTYLGSVRERVLDRFETLEPALVELVIQHEQQHNETILQLLRQLPEYQPASALTDEFVAPPASLQHVRLREAASRAYRPISRDRDWIEYPAGRYCFGSDPHDGVLVYDNEMSRHRRPVKAFEIAVRPVTCGEWADWLGGGGLRDRTSWSVLGWEWLAAQGPSFDGAPANWIRQDGQWLETGFGEPRPINRSAPVCHINWFEADAFARAHEARLPTEFEWEVAASYDPRGGAGGRAHRFAWGDGDWTPGAANLDQLAFGTLPTGSTDHGFGPIDMNGQVWEWTSSDFKPYPGFAPFAYAEYSAPFFGHTHRVLRGGSWATRARSVSNRFRNWDLPERRQIFAGLRLARGGEGW